MNKPWTRQDTQYWIAQLENRIEDIDYYLQKTIQWCEDEGVYDNKVVFACSLMTAVWVSYMRDEPISKQELFEILGVSDWYTADDAIYEFNSKYADLDHEDLLQLVVRSF